MTELVQSIIADGQVSAEETTQLREAIFADGKVTKEEVEVLFDIKSKCTICEEFKTLIVDAVKACVLEDDETPGVVSAEEGDMIANLINSDGTIDDAERKVLLMLTEATSIESQGLKILVDSVR